MKRSVQTKPIPIKIFFSKACVSPQLTLQSDRSEYPSIRQQLKNRSMVAIASTLVFPALGNDPLPVHESKHLGIVGEYDD